jgi:ferredoxin
MSLRHLRKIRIALAAIVFIAFLFLFLNLHDQVLNPVSLFFLRLQIFPSLLRFFALFFTASALGFLIIFLLTFFFGRIYCAALCPLGILQDIITRTANLFKKKKNRRFSYSENKKQLLRYGILAATILFWISGSLFLVNLLDPYSNFGKIAVTFFQPVQIWLNNMAAILLESQGSYIVRPLMVKSLPWNVAGISAGIFLTILIMASFRGRLFCNTLCPAGSMLGLIASRSRYQVAFVEESCTLCGKCEWACKAECINSKTKTVDHSRCVSCFNCFSACKHQAIRFRHISTIQNPAKKTAHHPGKRHFLLTFASALISIPALNKNMLAQDTSKPGMLPSGTMNPVTPPGSLSYDHFTKHCIACYLCVSACPKNVIVPSFFDYGLQGFMQPKLDFHKSFCNYDCVACTEVCPTGAITRQNRDEKHVIQIGVAKFLTESCIVTIDKTDCGACSEHCPTKAVDMVPYQNGLSIPEVTPELCIGCGACEFACPTEPFKAIYVESNLQHQEAQRIEESDGPKQSDMDDFPF